MVKFVRVTDVDAVRAACDSVEFAASNGLVGARTRPIKRYGAVRIAMNDKCRHGDFFDIVAKIRNTERLRIFERGQFVILLRERDGVLVLGFIHNDITIGVLYLNGCTCCGAVV